MDDKFGGLLDSLPEKPPRSRLEPYSELIVELRRRGRTYREIARILAEKCKVQAGSRRKKREDRRASHTRIMGVAYGA
jgi:hypothetical protein